VKIRKGEAVRLIMQATNVDNVKAIFAHFLQKIRERVPATDPSRVGTLLAVETAVHVCRTDNVYTSSSVIYLPLYVSATMLLPCIVWQCWTALNFVVLSKLTN